MTACFTHKNGSSRHWASQGTPEGEGGGGGGGGEGNNQEQQKDDKNNKRGPGGGGHHQEWVDQCHPKIVSMMADSMAARGMRIQLTEILDARNKCITDRPAFPDYVVNGRPTICWAHILGRCTFWDFAFKRGHVPRNKIPKKFANEVVAIIAPGIAQVVQCEDGSPEKCPSIEPSPASWEFQTPGVQHIGGGEQRIYGVQNIKGGKQVIQHRGGTEVKLTRDNIKLQLKLTSVITTVLEERQTHMEYNTCGRHRMIMGNATISQPTEQAQDILLPSKPQRQASKILLGNISLAPEQQRNQTCCRQHCSD
jgi:hypothetical protein